MNPMQTHVKVLAILHIVFGALGVLIGLAIFAFFGGIAGLIHMDHDPDAALMVPIPGIIAGIGLLSYQPWARILTIVLSILDLVSFPFGTALGIYGLWILFTADGARIFERSASSSMQYQR